jgi:hypothetical protein
MNENETGGACGAYSRGILTVSVGRREGKKSSGRHTRRWENNTKTDLKETGQEGVDGIHLAQDRDKQRHLVTTVMSFRFPRNAMNLLTSWELLACNAEGRHFNYVPRNKNISIQFSSLHVYHYAG